MHVRCAGLSGTNAMAPPLNVPPPLLKRMEMVDEFEFATAMSTSPSPSRSRARSPCGLLPAAYVEGHAIPGACCAFAMRTRRFDVLSATARSIPPSPSRFARAHPAGLAPGPRSVGGLNWKGPAPVDTIVPSSAGATISGNASSLTDANSTDVGRPGTCIVVSICRSPPGLTLKKRIFRSEGIATATASTRPCSSQVHATAAGSPGISAVTCSEKTILLMP